MGRAIALVRSRPASFLVGALLLAGSAQAAENAFHVYRDTFLTLLLQRPVKLGTFNGMAADFVDDIAPAVVNTFYFAWISRLCLATGSAGAAATPGASLADCGRRFWPIAALSVVMYVLTQLGMLLVLAPGLFFMMASYVAVQAFVVERLRPLVAIRRSFDLTKGRRWNLFGLTLAISIAALIAMTILKMALVPKGVKLNTLAAPPLFTYFVSPMIASANQVIFAALSTAIYEQLTGTSRQPATVIAEVFS